MTQVSNSVRNNSIQLVNISISQCQGLEIILNNLSSIDYFVSNILSKFQSQCAQYKTSIQDYLYRINICQKKILALQKQNKALTFVSPSQLSQKYKLSYRQSILNDCQQRVELQNIQNTTKHLLNPQTESFIDEDQAVNLYEKLVSQSRQIRDKEKNPLKNDSISSNDNNVPSLETYPKRIKCVDSLLVFDTKINPFRKNQQSDKHVIINQNHQKFKKSREQNPVSQLQESPIGIKEQIQIYQASDLIYIPYKRDIVNDVTIPQNLDLEGIVDDFELDFNQLNQQQISSNFLIQNPKIPDPYKNVQPSVGCTIQSLENNQCQQILSQLLNQNQIIYQAQKQEYSADPLEQQINTEQIVLIDNPLQSTINTDTICNKEFSQYENAQQISYQQEFAAIQEENSQQIEIKQNRQNDIEEEIKQLKLKLQPVNKSQNQQFVKKDESQIGIKMIMHIRKLERQPPSKEGKGPKNRVGYFSDSSDDTDQEPN
ncbi:hypothetical protein ABPG74_016614 [Tetrahymena malaccensis]